MSMTSVIEQDEPLRARGQDAIGKGLGRRTSVWALAGAFRALSVPIPWAGLLFAYTPRRPRPVPPCLLRPEPT